MKKLSAMSWFKPRAVQTWICLLLWQSNFTILLAQLPPALAPSKDNYAQLILEAASCQFLGRSPSEQEMARAEAAYEALARDKQSVAAWEVEELRKAHVDARLLQGLGYVLWRFGPEFVGQLEPGVLSSEQSAVRLRGLSVLGMGNKPEPAVVDLVLKVQERDRSEDVKAAAIQALTNLRAAQQGTSVLPCLTARTPSARTSAIQFFWNFPSQQAFESLKARLGQEREYEPGFWLACTLCRYTNFPSSSLLEHLNAGIRCGALHFFALKAAPTTKTEDQALLAWVKVETDSRCLFELAQYLFNKRNPQCRSVLQELLKRSENPDLVYKGSNLKTAARTLLANLP